MTALRDTKTSKMYSRIKKVREFVYNLPEGSIVDAARIAKEINDPEITVGTVQNVLSMMDEVTVFSNRRTYIRRPKV